MRTKKQGRPLLLEIKIGDVFGDLECVGTTVKGSDNSILYIMECKKCGRSKEMRSSTIRLKHGITHKACGKGLKMKDITFYNRWQSMRLRTNNPSYEHYKDYGGRGINSDAFENFIDFYDTMYESFIEKSKIIPKNKLSLERIDVDGNYCPENCCWIDISEQKSNQRKTKRFIVTFPDGHEEYCESVRKFAEKYNLDDESIYSCLKGEYNQHYGYKFRNATENQILKKAI